MSENGRARALDAFIDELNRLRQAAGPPSYARMERLSRRLENAAETASGVRVITLARSTTNDILTGDRRARPKWEWVASYWAVLRLIAEQNGMDPARLGTLEEWRVRYDAIDAASSGPGGGSAATEHGRLVPSAGGYGDDDWWRDHGDVVPEWFATYLSLEPSAGVIRVYEPYFVPGLLQTRDYARAVVRSGPDDEKPEAVERRVELRMRRQRILDRARPPRVWAVVDERSLRTGPADAAALRGQVRHLLELCERPHVTIQVRPDDGGVPGVTDAPVSLLRFPGTSRPDLIYLEQATYALYPDKPKDVRHYLHVLNRLSAESPPPVRTPAVLRRLLSELEDAGTGR
jgi:hypothetical protein